MSFLDFYIKVLKLPASSKLYKIMDNEHFPKTNNIATLHKYTTEYNADSVEWCPHDPSKHLFVCGTYQLIENKDNKASKRVGCILLFSVNSNGLDLRQKLDTPAVLDQKWCPNQIGGHTILGVANAERSLALYQLENNQLKFLTKFVFLGDDTETLILSLDWSTNKYSCQQPHVACSDSKGNIHLLQLVENELILEQTFHGHDFQAWITGFYYWDPNIFFSGGDDSVMLLFDKRCGTSPLKKVRHDAGVTAFHSNKSHEFIIAAGSYDEQVKLLDTRTCKPIDSVRMPGPLWRLKWDPFAQTHLLASCMLGGVHIINTNQCNSLDIIDSYYEHENIAYGGDWSFLNCCEVDKFDHKGNLIFASCSFYDNLLCVSKCAVDLPI